MDLWDTIMIALVIVSVIAFSLWARTRATPAKSISAAKPLTKDDG
jgi:hypothetical protein